MRKSLLAITLLVAALTQTGCVVPIYSSSPDDRARQLIYESESLRHVLETWERVWFLDMPDQITPYRTHGGLI